MEFTNTTQILIQYVYEGIQYYIVNRDNKIYAVCYDDKKVRVNFKDNEKDIALRVFSSFLVDDKISVKVDTAIVNNNEYIIFYDSKHRNYYWKNKNIEIKNNPIDNIMLNMKYNNQSVVHYSKNNNLEEKSANKFFKKVITLAGTGAVIVAYAIATLQPISSSQGINISYEENGRTVFNEEFFDLTEKEKYSEYEEVYKGQKGIPSEFDLKTLENAIAKNDNLSIEEKEFIEYFYDILDEHKEYIDFNLIAVRLNTLSIMYPGIDTSDISGEYDDENNVISFYNFDGNIISSFQDADKLTATHETGHAFTTGTSGVIHECSNEAWARASLDRFYNENKVTTKSYVKNEDGKYKLQGGGYQGFIPFYYMLTQFMTDEEILKYQYSCDLNIIGEALIRTEKTYGNNYSDSKAEERAYGLLSKLDNKLENEGSIYSAKTSTEALKQLDYYYKIKNGKSLYDDLNMFLLSDCIPCYNEFLKQNDEKFYSRNGIENKREFFIQIVKEELVKNNKINIEDKIDVDFYLVSYPDIFFNESDRRNMVIYINDITKYKGYSEEKEQVGLELEITPEICRRYETLCNERTNDIEK